MPRKRVYLAGPISRGDLQTNIDQARDAAEDLIEAGFAPIVPQLTCFLAENKPQVFCGFSHDTWMEVDLPWVEVADAVLRLPGESIGADTEVAHANSRGVPVFDNLADLMAFFSPPRTGTARRMRVLQDVAKCVCRDRQNTYGDAEDNFRDIASMATILFQDKLTRPFSPTDVALFSAAIKMCRLRATPEHRDSWIDLAGYAACGAGIVDMMRDAAETMARLGAASKHPPPDEPPVMDGTVGDDQDGPPPSENVTFVGPRIHVPDDAGDIAGDIVAENYHD